MREGWSTNVSIFNFQTHTGESHQQLSLRSTPPSPALLSCQDKDQQRLESAVLRALSQIDALSAHPLRAGRIRLAEGATPIVFLDGPSEGRPVSALFLQAILPVVDRGAPADTSGVRIRGIRGRDLYLGIAQTDAAIIIRGAKGVDWTADRRSLQQEAEAWGSTLCTQPTLTTEERESLEWGAHDPLVEMESKLLRRIGVFTRFSAAHSTFTYTSHNALMVESFLNHKVPGGHDLLVASLTDPQWGMGMSVREGWGSCDCYSRRPYSCTLTLTPPSEDSRLVLMFQYNQSRVTSADFGGLGADKRWLNRVFPSADERQTMPWSIGEGEVWEPYVPLLPVSGQ